MWKLLFQSVQGESHRRGGQPCQDCCRVRLQQTAHGPVLVLACADGAGSARYADLGARLACGGIVGMALADLREGLAVRDVERDTVLSWHQRLRRRLEQEADCRDAPLQQFACTFLLAVVGAEAAAFAQVGDGVIVAGAADGYEAVFWPQTGEYANSTNFLTDPGFADELVFQMWPQRIEELALLTDGLQALALNFAGRNVH